MINRQFAFGEEIGEGHFQKENQRTAVDARPVGGVHGDGLDAALRLDGIG